MSRFLAFLIFVSTTVHAGFEQTDVGSRAKALGGCYVGLADDAWGMFFNAGGLSAVHCTEASVLYVPAQFGLEELRYAAGAIVIPTGLGVIGLGIRSYGFELYHEFTGTGVWARELSGVGVGITLNYHSVSIKNYGSASTIGIDVGLKTQLTHRLSWGIAARNINSPTIGSSQEPLPQTFSSGIAYVPFEGTCLLFDYEKQLGFEPSARFGCEYWVVPQCAFRVGMSEEPTQFAAGMGVRISRLQIDYALSEHEDLGWTQQASLTIRWGD